MRLQEWVTVWLSLSRLVAGLLAGSLIGCGPGVETRMSTCSSNVKQITVAALAYANDWDQHLPCARPGTTEPAAIQLAGYMHEPVAFHRVRRCPAQSRWRQSYFYQPPDDLALAGNPDPLWLGLFGEGLSPAQRVYPHRGLSAAGFADGHVRLLRADGPGPDQLYWRHKP